MAFTINIHRTKRIKAEAGPTSGAPLTLRLRHPADDYSEITIFTDDLALSARLATAINDAVAQHEETQAAACDAA